MKRAIRVALVDDHPLLRRGLREVLLEQGDFQIVGEGATAREAVELSRNVKSDIIIIDVNMPGDGLSAVQQIARSALAPRVLVLSVFDNMANVRTAMEHGAAGYVLKGIEGDELARILRSVHGGNKHVEPGLAAKLLAHRDGDGNIEAREEATGRARARVRFDALTKREQQIFDLMAKGMSNREIAKKLRLGEETVKHYNTQLFHKLGVRNRTEAALLQVRK